MTGFRVITYARREAKIVFDQPSCWPEVARTDAFSDLNRAQNDPRLAPSLFAYDPAVSVTDFRFITNRCGLLVARTTRVVSPAWGICTVPSVVF
jgi:hypothetical protein